MIKITRTPISLRLISFDPWQEIITEGWQNSRPQLKGHEIDFNEVLKIDTPVSELAGFVAEFTVPILFREIICSARDHMVWARTSRVDNLVEEWRVIDSINDEQIKEIESLAEKLLGESKDQSQDNFRKNLPISYMTSFTTRISLRSAIKLLKYFLNLKQFPIIATAADDFSHQLMTIIKAAGINIGALLPVIKLENYCPEISGKYEKRFIESNNHIVINGNYSIMLRSQIIRHRLLHVVDDLSKYFSKDNCWSIPISDKMEMSISATRNIWESIIAKRMCWLSHASIWADIINDITKNQSGVIEALIPCKDGVCPYGEDCRQRLIKNDPGVPCPRFLAISSDEYKSEVASFDNLKEKMEAYTKESLRPEIYWNQQILKFEEKYNESI